MRIGIVYLNLYKKLQKKKVNSSVYGVKITHFMNKLTIVLDYKNLKT